MPRLILLAALLMGGFTAGWTVNGWRLNARQADLIAAYDTALDEAVAAARAQVEATARRLAEADTRHTTALLEATDEINRLRLSVAAGAVRLRVRATCPAAAAVPGSAAPSGVGDDTAPELAGDAREAYYTLRDQLTRMEAQLRWWQEAGTCR
ncbi:lysis system i-spanin subunit Rz [Novispirillum itersonii]|uniref:lysis system i-spanin subunit Rz n=1 Tax=Novispirillum itersonii TaxID=189 RepID=UPI0003685EA9|nr:lysis system i-spanin subunit Rz [Novispirillum itersonii]